MDWIQENKPLAAIIGIVLAVSAGLGYMVFDAWSRFAESKETYLALGNQIAAMNSARLAPTEENVKLKKVAVEEYAASVNKLGGALLYIQAPLKPVKDIEFQTKLKAKIAEARKKASVYNLTLPGEFAFGFDDYTKSLPKSAEAAADLSLFLDAMDELLDLFMKSGASSVDLFERSKLPVESAQAANTGALPGNNRGAPASIVSKRQASVILTLDQGALQLLISRLANPSEMPYFSSLRLVRIENQRTDGPLRSEVVLPQAPEAGSDGNQGAEGAAVVAPGEAQPASNEIKAPAPAAPDSVPVIGEEKLKVQLEIDFLRFSDAAQGVAAAVTR